MIGATESPYFATLHTGYSLRVGAPMNGGITLRGETDIARSITFLSSGRITSFSVVIRQLVGCDDRSRSFASNVREKARVVVVRNLGSSRVVKGNDASVTVTSCAPT